MLGKRIKELRERNQLSLDQLCARTGLPIEFLREVEAGPKEPLAAETLLKIVDGLGLKGVKEYGHLFCLNRPARPFKAYCVGLVKTGTTSLARLFEPYASRHEFFNSVTGAMLKKLGDGEIARSDFRDYLVQRDAEADCAMDSSSIHYLVLNFLADEYPAAKFVFTLRDCFSWLDSLFNYLLSSPGRRWYNPARMEWVNEFARVNRDAPEFKRLALDFADQALLFWGRENSRVLVELPKARSLVLRTRDISRSLDALARFVGVPPQTLNHAGAHSFKGEHKFDVLRQLPREFLKERARHGQGVLDAYFPQASLEKFLGD